MSMGVRQLGHFAGWIVFQWGGSYFLTGYITPAFANLLSLFLLFRLTLYKETAEYLDGKQSDDKTILDIAFKSFGLLVGAATGGWWS